MIRLSDMRRIFYLVFAYSLRVSAQQGSPDPAFDRIPFAEWLKESGDSRIRWSAEAFPGRLGAHQRLSAHVLVRVEGTEFVKRNGPGQLVVFLEIRDREGGVFQTHRALHFADLKVPSALSAVHFEQNAFVRPGDYQVAVAVFDTQSKEHALKRIKLHVPELSHDPLPDSWRNLPWVEFVTFGEPPDAWYLPEISSRLSLPVDNERPVRVEIVVNESPTEATRRVGRAMKRNMGNLIPALKVLSQMEVKNGEINVTLLDLERRKVSYSQEEVSKLDWSKLRAALVENDPNSIDVHALENHEQNAQFFVSEIRKRLERTETNGDVPLGLTAEPARVLIVLSGPMAFPRGQDLTPIEATPEPGSKVFYVRYNPPRPDLQVFSSNAGGRSMRVPMPPMQGGHGAPSSEDSLARTLKPLSPKTFDVTTPVEFRNALASIMSELSRLK